MSKLPLCLVLLCWCAEVCPSAGDPVGTRCDTVEGAPSCVCRTQTGGVIDLTKIASYDGTPRFTGLKDPSNFTYDYNPCIGFMGKGDCDSVHIRQHGLFNATYAIAVSGTEEMWIDEHGEPYIYYTGQAREVFVHLVCDTTATDPVVTTIGDSEHYLTYEFTVRSVHACASRDPPPPDPVKGCEAIEGAPSCVCRTPTGVIDLTKLASYDGAPRFTGVRGPKGYLYDYNPCLSFTKTETCTKVHDTAGAYEEKEHPTVAIQKYTHLVVTIECNTFDHRLQSSRLVPYKEKFLPQSDLDYNTEQMRVEDGEVYIHYDTQTQRQTVVYLKCNSTIKDPILTTTGDSRLILFYGIF